MSEVKTDDDSKQDSESMENLNQKLDSVLIEFFECLGELYKEQANLENCMKNGYLMMSRARYSMGAKSVGVSQYNENKMKASKVVLVGIDNENDKPFKLVNSKDNPLVMDNIDGEGIRQRKKGNVETLGPQSESKETKHSKTTDGNDPLKWFGVLVPQSLRQSQTFFQQSVDQAIIVSNLKSRSISLRDQYKSLKKEKHLLA